MIETVHEKNGRFAVDHDRVRDYAMSIAANGLLNPITVRRRGKRFELLAGLHRLCACKTLGHRHIRATVVDADDVRAQTIRLAENTARSNLSPVEEARQLHYLVEASDQGVDAVAAAIGRRTEWVLDRLELITWPEPLLDAIHMRTVSLAAAKRLVRIRPEDLRDQRIRDAAHHGINARTAALWLQDSQDTQITQNEMPEISTLLRVPEYQTETRAICTICRTPTELDNVQRILVCGSCHSAIQNALTPQPQPDITPAGHTPIEPAFAPPNAPEQPHTSTNPARDDNPPPAATTFLHPTRQIPTAREPIEISAAPHHRPTSET